MTTTTTAVVNPASEKQVAFINTLLAERDIDAISEAAIRAHLSTLTKKQASGFIDILLAAPKSETKVIASQKAGIQEALSKAPKSKYAVPADELDIMLTDTPLTGDLLFIEIREYMNNLYMRRLTGSVGGFTRWKVPNDDAVLIMNIISQDPYKYTKLFGEHYSCCGSCGAELTDPISRELQLGPECRKKFGK
jgi:acyl-CoA reductase-like NAD-dependent aldehyde dehydrogenase